MKQLVKKKLTISLKLKINCNYKIASVQQNTLLVPQT